MSHFKTLLNSWRVKLNALDVIKCNTFITFDVKQKTHYTLCSILLAQFAMESSIVFVESYLVKIFFFLILKMAFKISHIKNHFEL